ncbi:Hypothetical predicted protein [Scomber scombrus]|uniref:Uncharacterized protein n=1 Tax=Scomber scombrus TaxID=13677 RepID=A0AAV1PY57_SCOSC
MRKDRTKERKKAEEEEERTKRKMRKEKGAGQRKKDKKMRRMKRKAKEGGRRKMGKERKGKEKEEEKATKKEREKKRRKKKAQEDSVILIQLACQLTEALRSGFRGIHSSARHFIRTERMRYLQWIDSLIVPAVQLEAILLKRPIMPEPNSTEHLEDELQPDVLHLLIDSCAVMKFRLTAETEN